MLNPSRFRVRRFPPVSQTLFAQVLRGLSVEWRDSTTYPLRRETGSLWQNSTGWGSLTLRMPLILLHTRGGFLSTRFTTTCGRLAFSKAKRVRHTSVNIRRVWFVYVA